MNLNENFLVRFFQQNIQLMTSLIGILWLNSQAEKRQANENQSAILILKSMMHCSDSLPHLKYFTTIMILMLQQPLAVHSELPIAY